jgi:hypothetical protein
MPPWGDPYHRRLDRLVGVFNIDPQRFEVLLKAKEYTRIVGAEDRALSTAWKLRRPHTPTLANRFYRRILCNVTFRIPRFRRRAIPERDVKRNGRMKIAVDP